MRDQVKEARKRQELRTQEEGRVLNAHLTPDQMKRWCILSTRASDFLSRCLHQYPLSARGYARILKVARTVADLDGAERIHRSHMEKAVMYRVLDRLQSVE
jgi:magnesium chelatase family protein